MSNCSNCGNELKESVKYCTNCGKEVKTNSKQSKIHSNYLKLGVLLGIIGIIIELIHTIVTHIAIGFDNNVSFIMLSFYIIFITSIFYFNKMADYLHFILIALSICAVIFYYLFDRFWVSLNISFDTNDLNNIIIIDLVLIIIYLIYRVYILKSISNNSDEKNKFKSPIEYKDSAGLR